MGDLTCRRCPKEIDRNNQFFTHSWDEQPSTEAIQAALDNDEEFEDWHSDGAVLCPSCHADFLVFLG